MTGKNNRLLPVHGVGVKMIMMFVGALKIYLNLFNASAGSCLKLSQLECLMRILMKCSHSKVMILLSFRVVIIVDGSRMKSRMNQKGIIGVAN